MAFIGSNSGAEAPDPAGTHADIVVGLTSYNDVRTVGAVVSAVEEGLSRYFGSCDLRIVLADTRSTDGTREVARAAASAPLVEVECPAPAALAAAPYHGYPGRPGAVRAILQTASGSARQDARCSTPPSRM